MKKTFVAGALGYGALEILWRGRTHPSMLLAGGVCLCAIKKLCQKKKTVLCRTAQSAAIITAVELTVGLLFNRDKKVWDYSKMRGNFLGQICPLYSFLWFLLSLPIVIYYNRKEGLLWKN